MLRFILLVCLWGSMASKVPSRHRRHWIIASFEVEEEEQGPFPHQLGTINIHRDDGYSYAIQGEGVDEEPQGLLSFDQATGAFYINRAVDFEEKQKLKLWLEVKGADHLNSTKLRVEVTVKDINDNPPTFEKNVYSVNVKEEQTQGSSLLTVFATDADQDRTPNSTFDYKIKSVSPNPPDIEFFINKSGRISFKGCLDYEVTDKFTVVVEATDHGDVVKLSSSTTVIINVQDGNNNLPVISRQTGSGKVKEREVGTSLLRLQVTDRDVPHTPAWRAKYTVHGDGASHFKVETDDQTNDGILTVVKPLDFEVTPQLPLSISVENEVPYFSCKVLEKPSLGLWKVSDGSSLAEGSLHSVQVVVNIVDVNDPPEFSWTVKDVFLEENSAVGTWVEKVKAVDPDSNQAKELVYKVGHDPGRWLRVDPKTGNITTVKNPDRESRHVVNGVYTVILLAVDSGSPPMTASTTLNIHISDLNDNLPQPVVDTVAMCLSDVPTTANISTSDLDGELFGGPFFFELLGDVAGRWRLSPAAGFSAGLVKEPDVYAGRHKVRLKISDLQGQSAVYNISVIVCDCSVSGNCQSRRASGTRASFSAIGIVLAALLLPLVLLLLVVSISCKEEFTPLHAGVAGEEVLLKFNTEERGTDCMIPDSLRALSAERKRHNSSVEHSQYDGMQRGRLATKGLNSTQQGVKISSSHTKREDVSFRFSTEQTEWNIQDKTYVGTHQVMAQIKDSNDSKTSGYSWNGAVQDLLQQKLLSLQGMEEALQEDWLCLYTDEGDLDKQSELDTLTIPNEDHNSLQRALTDLGPAFIPLASIIKPQNTL